jgi:hypothetical protein
LRSSSLSSCGKAKTDFSQAQNFESFAFTNTLSHEH